MKNKLKQMIEDKKNNLQIVLTKDEVAEIIKEVMNENGLNVIEIHANSDYDEYIGHMVTIKL